MTIDLLGLEVTRPQVIMISAVGVVVGSLCTVVDVIHVVENVTDKGDDGLKARAKVALPVVEILINGGLYTLEVGLDSMVFTQHILHVTHVYINSPLFYDDSFLI